MFKRRIGLGTALALLATAGVLFSGPADAQDLDWVNAIRKASAESVATDISGNVYMTGSFTGSNGAVDFDPGPGTLNLTSRNAGIFVAKYDSDGQLLWAKKVDSAGYDFGYDIAVDDLGNVLVVGTFANAADFDPGPGVFNLSALGDADSFVLKLSTNGNFVWAARFGPGYGISVAAEASGAVYSTGAFMGTADFDPGPGVFSFTADSPDDVFGDMFVTKLSADGDFVWAKKISGGPGSGSEEIARALALDGNENVLLGGSFFFSVDFDPGPGTFVLSDPNGSGDIFVLKLNKDGDFEWARQMRGVGNETADGIAADSDGNVITVGEFTATVDFDPGPGVVNLRASNDSSDSFASKLTSSGVFGWARRQGTPRPDAARDVVVAEDGSIYSAGFLGDAHPADFNVGDVFVSKRSSAGTLLWTARLGGSGIGSAHGVALNEDQEVLGAGVFRGTIDFDPGPETANRTSANPAAFLFKLNE